MHAAKPRAACAKDLLGDAEEIPFPDLDARLTQDCVGRGAMEIEVRQCEVEQILLAGELQRIATDGEDDLAALAAVDLLGLEVADIGQHGGNARAQLAHRLLGFLRRLRDLDAGQARGTFLGEAAGDLHLAGEGQHIGEQTVSRQRAGIELFGFDVRLRFVQNAGQVAKHVGKAGHTGLVHGKGHEVSLWLIRQTHELAS